MSDTETRYGFTKSAMLAYSYGGHAVAHIVDETTLLLTGRCGVKIHSAVMIEDKQEICLNCLPCN